MSELGYSRLSKTQQKITKKLTEYVARDLGEKVIDVALREFFIDDGEMSDLWEEMMEDFSAVFWPWLFYTFKLEVPDIDEEDLIGLMEPDTTIAEMFMRDKAHKLDKLELDLLSACNRRSFSFFEVESLEPGQGFQALDLLTGKRQNITDSSASRSLAPWEIIFAMTVECQGYGMSIGNGKYKFQPLFKPYIIQFAEELEGDYGPLSNEDLLEDDYDLRDFFFYLQDLILEPPQLQNSDGDPLSMRTLHYEITSPEQAFQALAPLCVHEKADRLREEAELDDSNNVQKIHFVWSRKGNSLSKGLENTTLGHISIEGNKMTVEVNSEAREEEIKKEIVKRLGNQCSYKVTNIQSIESILENEDLNAASSISDDEQKELQNRPEVQEAMKEIMDKHWEGWLDTDIPALGGKTPRQAVQTVKGRESVQALLRDYELNEKKSVQPVPQKPYIDWVRKELGLSD
ncbi:MAG: hypothetical protein ACOCV7_05715 [Desulfonatronovibrionaceae bacterium]